MVNEEGLNATTIVQRIKERLMRADGKQLVEEFESIIARGVANAEAGVDSKTHRAATPEEQLRILIELILAATSTPILIEAAVEFFECDDLVFATDDGRESMDINTPQSKVFDEYRDAVTTLASVLDEIELPVPEVA